MTKSTRTAWNKGKKCPQLSGANHYRWNNGKMIHTKGYISIFKPDYPASNKYGYILEHRFIMEQHLKRYLQPSERVHHINNIPCDNRIENLKLCSDESEHQSYHRTKPRKPNSNTQFQ